MNGTPEYCPSAKSQYRHFLFRFPNPSPCSGLALSRRGPANSSASEAHAVAEQTEIEHILIDTTIVRAHQHSAGASKSGPEARGRSRGGLSTKLHLAVNATGWPLRLILKIVNTHSYPYFVQRQSILDSPFKTSKYCPDVPDRFGCIEDTRPPAGSARPVQHRASSFRCCSHDPADRLSRWHPRAPERAPPFSAALELALGEPDCRRGRAAGTLEKLQRVESAFCLIPNTSE